MSDLRDLPDLARDVRDRVVTPPYDAVSRRLRARRLRAAAGSLAAVALVVGGVAVLQSVAPTAGPAIPQPAETEGPVPPTDESQWRAVVDGTDAHPFEVDGTDDGSIAVIWRALEQPEPSFALVIREADGTVHGRRLDAPVDLTPVPGGWVGVNTARGYLIGTDGTWTDLGEPDDPRQARPGDVFIRGQDGSSSLYSPQDRSWTTMPALDGDAYLTAGGQLVTCSTSRGQVSVVTDIPRQTIVGDTCVMAGRGDDVAVAGLGDDTETGDLPLTGLLLTNGNTWAFPRFQSTPIDDVVSMVIVPGGRALITDSDGDAVLFGADGSVVELRQPVGPAFVAGERVHLRSYDQERGPLRVLEDDLSWQETPLPGMESSQE